MLIVYLLLSALIVVGDQLVKWWTVSNLALGESQSFIPKVLSLTYVRNTGSAWSMFEGQMWFFYIITIVIVPVAVYFLVKNLHNSKWLTLGISLALGGALGNFIDRLRLGYVVDMFATDFISFPVFNVADCALVVGMGMIFIYLLLEDRLERKNAKN
ncbi:signal peptidase II [Enterococcus sp. PF1-24]|uniref:signal peptidase II n=1 Tax=unclassified Enterococcus TaxID=2608891 RepID=UPI002475152C|nr:MULTISPECIES: signal peptidase II [unclassified Enterococcus]MDH6364064.1 signal peptidase II [Enterococcus sp. PFB1-1]MDH6401165.1 signal peptidase II [Enterococcus sp. PF1-24]